MKAYDPDDQTFKPAQRDARDQQLRVAVTFNRPGQLGGPTKFGARMSTDSVAAFMPDPVQTDLALAELTRRGFVLTGRGSLSASMRCTRTSFEALFQTKLERMSAPGRSATQFDSVLYPPEGAAWNPAPALQALLDDVYIQWPHIYLAKAADSARTPGNRQTRSGKRGSLDGIVPSAVAPRFRISNSQRPPTWPATSTRRQCISEGSRARALGSS